MSQYLVIESDGTCSTLDLTEAALIADTDRLDGVDCDDLIIVRWGAGQFESLEVTITKAEGEDEEDEYKTAWRPV